MAYYNFNEDLSEGQKGENIVIEHLKKNGGTLISKNNDNRYDVIIERKGKKIKYEIKTDFFCNPNYDTGNIFVEVECRGKKSGIMVTEAKWFVTYFKHFNEIWYIKTKDLLEIIEKNKEFLKFLKNAGDSKSNTKGWLIPKWMYADYFKVFNLNE